MPFPSHQALTPIPLLRQAAIRSLQTASFSWRFSSCRFFSLTTSSLGYYLPVSETLRYYPQFWRYFLMVATLWQAAARFDGYHVSPSWCKVSKNLLSVFWVLGYCLTFQRDAEGGELLSAYDIPGCRQDTRVYWLLLWANGQMDRSEIFCTLTIYANKYSENRSFICPSAFWSIGINMVEFWAPTCGQTEKRFLLTMP